MRLFLSLMCVAATVCAGGCGELNRVVEPKTITLEDAMASVGRGLNQMSAEAAKGQTDGRSFGLSAQECTVTFNVSAAEDATKTGKLTVDVSAAPPALAEGLGAKIGGEVGSSDNLKTARGNTIVVKFFNPIFAGKDTVVHSATTQPSAADNLEKVMKTIESHQKPAALPQ